MLKLLCSINKNPSILVNYLSFYGRFYRTKSRKRVSVEFNKPSLYDPKRNAPSKLLKANLFTPESAGHRELPMLCFWIVNYGYADYSILTRYVQCSIETIKKLKIKSIALIFHSVSKYLHNNSVSISEPNELDEYNSELRNRELLIKKSIELIIESSKLLPNLFINAVPKDLGMISLSMVNIYELYVNECNIDENISETKQIESLKDNTREVKKEDINPVSVGKLIIKLFQPLSQEIIPKFPFCELDEFAAFSKSFSKIGTEWSKHFMHELSLEISSLLMERIEDLELLSNGRFIGEDLVEGLNKIPRDLSSITCCLSKCKIGETKFWDRANKTINLIIGLKKSNFGIKEIDITTLTLLCTSMSNYVDVTEILKEMIQVCEVSDQSSILVGFNTSLKLMDNQSLASQFLDKIDVSQFLDINPRLVSQFIINFSRNYKFKASNKLSEIREGILSLLNNNPNTEVLCSIYVSGNDLNLSIETKLDLCNRISTQVTSLETQFMVSVLVSSLNLINNSSVRNLCKNILDTLTFRIDEISYKILPSLLELVLVNFGGNLEFIKRACHIIDENYFQFNSQQMLQICNKVSSMGLNINKLFNKNIGKIKELMISGDQISIDYGDISQFDNKELSPDEMYDMFEEESHIEFLPKDPDEISKIASHTLKIKNLPKILNPDDFRDYEQVQEPQIFELKKYPDNEDANLYSDYKDSFSNTKNIYNKSKNNREFNGPNSESNTIQELRNDWSTIRQNVQ